MKKGYIGPYNLGFISGASQALKLAEDVTSERGVDLESLFYSTAFQAGVDIFLVSSHEDKMGSNSDFVLERTSFVDGKDFEVTSRLVMDTFSSFLPEDWQKKEEYQRVMPIAYFINDLLVAMSTGSSMLSPWGIPDVSEVNTLLPTELAQPISMLFSMVTDVQITAPVPQKIIEADSIQRFNEIITSDIFNAYSDAQSALDDDSVSVDKTLPIIAMQSRSLYTNNTNSLAVMRTGAGILQFTPKLIDAAFGKLPGALADCASKLGINYLENRQRVVIYDFRSTVEHILLSNLIRMLKTAEKKR